MHSLHLVALARRVDNGRFASSLVYHGVNRRIATEVVSVDNAVVVIVELVFTASVRRSRLLRVGVRAAVQRVEHPVLVVVVVFNSIDAPVAVVVLTGLSRSDQAAGSGPSGP